MNIKQAKEQIKNTITAYLTKDEFGRYCLPPEKQRPVFLIGAPGIGKTAIMKQIAEEVGVGLLSYSMTHHTRQSLLGLPFIEHRTYNGKECSVSEYTMSEIIASVHDLIESSGISEGILFIDEINCVSETLTPVMLQFLQYKVFGKHKVPDGWIVVAAGNPPEYNDSVHEFDIATWDRLKRIDVEPDFDVWKEFAYATNVHPAIITYLSIKRDNFFNITSTVDGKRFVTARGWDDLGKTIELYEKNGIVVDEKLISQYLQNKTIATDFANYYDLYYKYKKEYSVEDVLNGCASEELCQRVHDACFDEKYTLIGLLLESCNNAMRNVIKEEKMLELQAEVLRKCKHAPEVTPKQALLTAVDEMEKRTEGLKIVGALSYDKECASLKAATALRNVAQNVQNETKLSALTIFKKYLNTEVSKLKASASAASKMLSNAINFCDKAFSEQEISILMVELTANTTSAEFIGKYGCAEYFAHNKSLLIYERGLNIDTRLKQLNVDD